MHSALVIPCFNEASRLDTREVQALLACAELNLLFVNDGSTDGTARVLEQLVADYPLRVTMLNLPANQGKGEAVRRGLRQALAAGAETVGFADADFATPARELVRLLDIAAKGDARVVFGSRLKSPGPGVARTGSRQFMGRTFARIAAAVVGLPIRDTQCGAKLFRADPVLGAALAKPFLTRWAFDVELLARLRYGVGSDYLPADFCEVPLQIWLEMPGSKLTVRAKVTALLQMALIYRDVRRLRQAARRAVPE